MLESGSGEKANVRVLGFDFGVKRIGVAVGQSLTGQASALKPLPARDGVPDWDQVAKVVAEWQPDAFVVGLPLNMDGSESEMCVRARKFANRLHGRFGKPAHLMDERLSSFEAKGMVMASSGERDFGRYSVDGLAASLIIESWFAQRDAAGGPAPADGQNS